jgi:hypothetical protein
VTFINGNGPGGFYQLRSGHFKISQDGEEKAKYVFSGSNFSYERAVILGQIYLYNETSRLSFFENFSH